MLLLVVMIGLNGCADLYNSTAKAIGCDAAAVDRGYCRMPKEAAK
jgi:hypothetical protein